MKDQLAPLLIKALALLPLGLLRGMGDLIGRLLWWGKGRSARVTRINIAHCFPELSPVEQRQLAIHSLQETAKTAMEAGAIWRHSWPWLERRILAREGEDILRNKLAQGQGVLVLAPHHGNWEVVAPYLASLAHLTAMYQPLKTQAMDDLVLSGRSKLNITMAPTNRKGVMMLFKALQGGTIVGVLPDQVPERDAGSEIAPFFGQPAVTMTLIHGLIQRTGCAVCSCYAERVSGGFKMVVMEADPAIYSDNQVQSVAGLNASVEACVRRVPAQYQWEYKRFGRLPAHLRNPYKSGDNKN
ncbi:lysophospholipid acyltransferase family protein [Cellvibrio japonicus]|nr:lysophospholipid acyltransferase family protein [Cellvibrio japonicus]QEI10817.1 lysophospholipid acyltransferase family protein [Cellvibrio japonicus]QEI14393.1 lysophospholipid acyltransferase family protein [Cellvibrio japonicus]QEI17971.1 lysophospholipid acyltransferase family protein [Cellvibrio japonicus]